MTVAKTLEPYVCGGTAATFGSCCIHPIDLAKVRMQLYGQLHPGKPAPGIPTIFRNMIASEGIASLYRGVDAAIGRQMVYGTARIGLHTKFSSMLVEKNNGEPISFAQKVASGMLSGAIAVSIGSPFDIALVRLQADGMTAKEDRRGYKNVFDALIRTTKEEGFSALYSGVAPNILRGMSMNVGMMSCNDQFQEFYAGMFNDPKIGGYNMTTRILASFSAGFTAGLFSMPFDLIKSRIMAQKPDPLTGEMPYKGIVDCMVKIVKADGPMGFYNGFSAYYLRCAPHAMIVLLSKDSITKSYREAFE